MAFNPYSAGKKNYGLKGAPNIGPVNKMGYRTRDRKKVAAVRAFAQQNATPEERRTQAAAFVARKRVAQARGINPPVGNAPTDALRKAALRRAELAKKRKG